MRIARLYMDAQDKTKFEIQGKSSVKYHLKANHIVEAKRWFWALNNAIQWTKDEAKAEQKQRQRGAEASRHARNEKFLDHSDSAYDVSTETQGTVPATAIGVPLSASVSRQSLPDAGFGQVGGITEDEGLYDYSDRGNDSARSRKASRTAIIQGDLDDDEEYGDDASVRDIQPSSKDAFNITANSASLQLSLLSQVSAALQAQSAKDPTVPVSNPQVAQAISTYEAAVRSLQGLVNDLLKISRDRDAYWQYRLDREEDIRRLWEDSMAKIAKEQEELEGRMGESEDKRKRTKKALREALEGGSLSTSPQGSRRTTQSQVQMSDAVTKALRDTGSALPRRKSIGIRDLGRRKSTIADLTNLSDSDSDEDEEFFDAVDAGEVEIIDEMPLSPQAHDGSLEKVPSPEKDIREMKKSIIAPSFRGYEDPVRTRLKMDIDDRPKISLWVSKYSSSVRSSLSYPQGILKSMIGKDMTKMTLPVSFNEPTSLLQRVAEDMEYTDLLDTAADRVDSTERMVYVAAFAASEYASTIGRVAKPFNPLLGETYEYVRPDKGYRFFIEQVSHHPPIGAAWAEAPKWDYYVSLLSFALRSICSIGAALGRVCCQIQVLREILRHQSSWHLVFETSSSVRRGRAIYLEESHQLRCRNHHRLAYG